MPSKFLKIFNWCCLLMLLLTGCASAASAKAPGLRVSGAYDMTPLAAAVQKDFATAAGVDMQVQPSASALNDLQSGRADVVILGREPGPDEISSLQLKLVGYDAVCVLISTRTFNGGLQQQDNTSNGGLFLPEAKFKGFQDMSLDQLKSYEANLLQVNSDQDHWFLNDPPYFTYQAYYDPITNAPSIDPKNPKVLQGMWVWNAVDLQGENFLAGKFDTQAVVMDKLGFPQSLLNNAHLSFAAPIFDSEEELISGRYEVKSSQQMTEQTSAYPFEFFIRLASRRVTLRAIQHDFLVSALRIAGVDPMGDPSVIYNNSYPLSRKIYVVTRQNPSTAAQKFVDYLLSPAGQKDIADSQFLPLPASQ